MSDLPENDVATAMGDALSPGVLTVGSTANNTAVDARRPPNPTGTPGKYRSAAALNGNQ